MDGCLKISDAMNMVRILEKSGINVTFDVCDMTIGISGDLYSTDDGTIFIPVSETFEDMDDVISYTAYMYRYNEQTVKVLNDSRIVAWLNDYNAYMVNVNHGMHVYYELARDGGLICFIDALTLPNGYGDRFVGDIVDVLINGSSWDEIDETSRYLIEEFFAIRTIYSEKHN